MTIKVTFETCEEEDKIQEKEFATLQEVGNWVKSMSSCFLDIKIEDEYGMCIQNFNILFDTIKLINQNS